MKTWMKQLTWQAVTLAPDIFRIPRFRDLLKKLISMNLFFIAQFNYYSLVWIDHSKTIHSKVNNLPWMIMPMDNAKCKKLMTRLRLGLSHLSKNKFKQVFKIGLIPHVTEPAAQFFLHCPLFTNERNTLCST